MGGKNKAEPKRTGPYAGISVDAKRSGFSIGVVDANDMVTDVVRLTSAESVSRYLREQKPTSIAIHGFAPNGSSRLIVRAADRSTDRVNPYPWKIQSEALWAILRRDFPSVMLCEAFPSAVQDALLTEPTLMPLSLLQSRLLRSYTNEFLDAILAAVAARRMASAAIGATECAWKDPFRDYTLTLITEADRILLGRKKRGLGTGYWNGFGGKVEASETIAQAAIREIHEEVGLHVKTKDLKAVGLLHFTFEDASVTPIRGSVFSTDAFTGVPTESDEMAPQWFAFEDIPYADMWGDDVFWFPLMLERRPFVASFHVGLDHVIRRRSLVETEAAASAVQRGKSRRPFVSM